MENEFVKQLFEYVEKTTEDLMNDTERYKAFLEYLSRMDCILGIANKMIIYGYDVEASDVRSVLAWNMAGITVVERNKPIYILTENDSVSGGSFMEVFDIKHTNAPRNNLITFQDSGNFTEAVLAAAPCKVTFTDKKLDDKQKCLYDSEKREILVTNDYKDFDEINQNLLREYAHYHLEDIYRELHLKKQMNDTSKDSTGQSNDYHHNREIHRGEALSASYMVCSRYKQKTPDISLIRWNSKTSLQTVRRGLGCMDTVFRTIVGEIDRAVSELNKEYENNTKD